MTWRERMDVLTDKDAIDEKALEKIVKGISYNNTVRYFGFDIK